MESETSIRTDPAAVFACAFSLWEECRKHASRDRSLDLSAAYSGWDQLMREVMRIGREFERWACEHVNFEELGEVWPYMLGDRFGSACLNVLSPAELDSFAEHDCILVALRLRLPLRKSLNISVPIDLTARNPTTPAGFKAFRIQTVRTSKEDQSVVPFTPEDDPLADDFSRPFFAIYGIDDNDELEHISDRDTYWAALDTVTKLAPGIHFARNPIASRSVKLV